MLLGRGYRFYSGLGCALGQPKGILPEKLFHSEWFPRQRVSYLEPDTRLFFEHLRRPLPKISAAAIP
jgi:hypothetical protein